MHNDQTLILKLIYVGFKPYGFILIYTYTVGLRAPWHVETQLSFYPQSWSQLEQKAWSQTSALVLQEASLLLENIENMDEDYRRNIMGLLTGFLNMYYTTQIWIYWVSVHANKHIHMASDYSHFSKKYILEMLYI